MTMKACGTCGTTNGGMRCGDDCATCYNVKADAWRQKMAVRQDPAQFKMDKLVRLLLRDHWMHEAKITPDYMPPHPRPDTRPRCTVSWTGPDGQTTWLRHSLGPLQGYSWDSYGDDFHSPELALLALSQAPAPPRIDYCIPTHGN